MKCRLKTRASVFIAESQQNAGWIGEKGGVSCCGYLSVCGDSKFSTSMTQFDFADTMKHASDAELVRIVFTYADEYQDAAIDAAKAELRRRNLDSEHLQQLKGHWGRKRRLKRWKSGRPLATHWKVLTFFLPLVFHFLFAETFAMDGYDRKSADITRWTFYGIAFYLTLAFLFNR
ncbi:hypothetical protein EPD60_03660 [Flaviaesturariibacter flavus]|uniref:Uncharacterized protein n=1 Tax=Flaviaesturariibacter flavus TaxID=2502780 RepID=A0A4R1BMQ7_9BACT|nr:hypothetical protein [Flaviaesturariibacter flavus]TCJ18608.1 hypothetical protein EPD60_03660 [Flaviaesturariibacter flavus]